MAVDGTEVAHSVFFKEGGGHHHALPALLGCFADFDELVAAGDAF